MFQKQKGDFMKDVIYTGTMLASLFFAQFVSFHIGYLVNVSKKISHYTFE